MITSVWIGKDHCAFLVLPSGTASLPSVFTSQPVGLSVSHFARLPGPAALPCGLDDSLCKLLARRLENKPHPGLMIRYSISLLERRPWGLAPGLGFVRPTSAAAVDPRAPPQLSLLAATGGALAVGWRGRSG